MADLPKRIALVYDSVNKWGGAEIVLLALHDLFPMAPLYTSVYAKKNAAWARVFPEIVTSFLQHIPFAKNNREFFPWLTPLAFESLNFSDYDAVISVTSADAKGIITSPKTFHLCYCLTPTRYLWSHFSEYKNQLGKMDIFTGPIFNYLKKWDLSASRRPDAYVSISRTVQTRIKKFYHQDSLLIYPPAGIEGDKSENNREDYFLYLGRLISYKNPETVIKVFNELNLPLVMIGTGKLEKKLKKLAKPNIKITGFISDREKNIYIKNCKALIFFHEEDFGIVPVEVQSMGKPVIALNRGGASETVIDGKTGVLISDPSPQALAGAVLNFDSSKYSPDFIKNHAKIFSRVRFKAEFVKIFKQQWTKYKNIYSY